MPIPDDAFFEAWEAELSDEEKPAFCRDGVVDEEGWAAAPVKVLFVSALPNLEKLPEDHAGPRDQRALNRDNAGTGSFGTPMARWAAMILDGMTAEEAQSLKKKALSQQTLRVAQIALKKTGGETTDDVEDIVAWALKHDERLLDEIDAIGPQVIVVCGTRACTAWPALLMDDKDAPPMWQSQEFAWEGRSVLAALSPSAPGTKTADKDADVARFAASPEVQALRDGK